MPRPRQSTPVAALLAPLLGAALLLAAGCGGGGTSPGYGDDGESPPGGGGSVSGTEIQMISGAYDFQFDPQVDTVSTGDTVTWTNQTQDVHTVQADDGTWSSGDVGANGSYQRVFDQAGEHPYYCRYHGSPGQGMHGTIVVEQ